MSPTRDKTRSSRSVHSGFASSIFGFAYSDRARSTSGSQKKAVLSKGDDNSVFLRSQQNKENAKVQVGLASTLYTQQLRKYFQNIKTMQSRSIKNDENQ